MATSNKQMGDMLRTKRKEMSDAAMGGPYTGPPKADVDVDVEVERETPAEPEGEQSSKFTVAAPGEASTGEQFEYEPMIDIPGAWVVYPPGVPCDDTEYRIQMDRPASKDDFAKMQQALDDAGAVESAPEASPVPSSEVEEDVY